MRDNTRHQQRQEKLKQQVEQRVNNAQQERGIVILITGNGKGKSTSGFGTVARAVGHGQKCGVTQFIKGNWECGERDLLQQHDVDFHIMATGFTWNTQDKAADTLAAQAVWEPTKKMLSNPAYDVVLLDELTYMIAYGYLDLDEVIKAIENRPTEQTVVITGRAAHRQLIELSDTVSEVKNVKHAFDNGIKARKGVDW
ncbi:cob(I)yrinic acid a,c-diamide adenosyltransferase [Thaumasiovibrio sp. DFM-14]|uniref:cob(I)yrinic acid a,c-diamide adenosyltransferase n=1 Tax=Thaumasiovibrio sp. DFM-14 TaxID=3384792 RepID=UPI00399F9E9B